MPTNTEVESLLRQGQLSEAIKKLEGLIRAKPADANLRMVLFQLSCLVGDWQRGMAQVNLAAEMDASNLLLAQECRALLQCEVLRKEIFAGTRTPLVFGQPEEWVGLMVQANQLSAQGHMPQSQQLREKALEAAPAVGGTINGEPFEWIADADTRLGPILEAMVEGKYFWVPFANVRQVILTPPAEPRDLVWARARLVWANGGMTVGFVPVRYPGSEATGGPPLQLARRTEWVDQGGEVFFGLGQRTWATDQNQYPLLDVRSIVLNVGAPAGADGSPPTGPAPGASGASGPGAGPSDAPGAT